MEILIIKLGAKGDVVRTLPLLLAIKKKYPFSNITWITKPSSVEILNTSPYIDKVLEIPLQINNTFDILYNLDIEKEATDIAETIKANKKYGFFSEGGYPLAFNSSAEYYLDTLFDDELKKSNTKTYQQMMFDVAELEYTKQHHTIYLTEEDKKYAEDFLKQNNLGTKKLIGIHVGASPRWPSKVWHKENLKEFIIKANKKGYKILMLGGPEEVGYHEKISDELRGMGIKIYRNNPLNSDKEFVALINSCHKIVTGDSFALHISLAMKKPTIGLFFCTSPNEVEGYGLLKKIVAPKIYEFFPEKSDQYSEELTKSITAKEVLEKLENKKVVNAIIKHHLENKFLVIKRAGGLHSGKWAFPGGLIEEGENVEQALRREIKEETNLYFERIIKKISEYSYPGKHDSETNGKCYLVKTTNFDVKINKEIQDFKWVSLEEFEELDYVKGLDEELLIAFNELQNK